MSESIHLVKVSAGTVESASPDFLGVRYPATLTLIEGDSDYLFKFVFFEGGRVPFTFRVAKPDRTTFNGMVQDPRGFNVSFTAALTEERITGTYQRPDDWGTFTLDSF